MTLEGGKELAEMLKTLPVKVSRNYMRDALTSGAEVVLAEAKSRCPVKTGALRDGLHIETSRRGGSEEAYVIVDSGDKAIQRQLHGVYRKAEKMARTQYTKRGKLRGDARSRAVGRAVRKEFEKKLKEHGVSKVDWQGTFYGIFQEFGFKHAGKNKKVIPGKAFMVGALQSQQGAATERIGSRLRERVRQSPEGHWWRQ